MSEVEVLQDARERIEKSWCQWSYVQWGPDGHERVGWCLDGAILDWGGPVRFGHEHLAAERLVAATLGFGFAPTDGSPITAITAWNDAEERTKEEVLDIIDRAIARAQVIEVLEGAKQLLIEHGWTQGHFAKNALGEPCPFEAEEATCFCAAGAIWRASGSFEEATSPGQAALEALTELVPNGAVAHWNDAEERTKDEVIATFDHIIKTLRGGS
jgi:hypothetical protein